VYSFSVTEYEAVTGTYPDGPEASVSGRRRLRESAGVILASARIVVKDRP
jgi:hypothetical protein